MAHQPMPLVDARYALEELVEGRMPDLARAAAGRIELENTLRGGGVDRGLQDAAAMLELLVATEGRAAVNVDASARAWLAALDKSAPM